jgi:MOSC domain-containing protein
MPVTLTGLFVYPIKSCRGIPVDQWDVDEFGLRYDRRFMLVDQTGEFMTQRDHPRLALVNPAITANLLRVNAPGMPPLELPLQPKPAVITRVTVWADSCEAVWTGEPAARWFSDFLGIPCSLVHMPADSWRPTNPAYDPTGSRVSFADAYPILVISEESLADLNRRLAQPLPMNRFRPNLTMSGGGPYAEDRWSRIQIGSMVLNLVKPCDRCVITTTDQTTTERGVEPLRTLATYRKVDGKVFFGQNAVHEAPGQLRVGDALTVSERERPG